MPFNVVAALLFYPSLFAVAVTVGLWIGVLACLGLPILLGWLRVAADTRQRVVQVVAPMIVCVAMLVVLVGFYLFLHTDWTPPTLDDSTATALFGWFAGGHLIWVILAIGGPFVLLVYFGLPSLLGLLGVPADRSEHVAALITGVLLVMGIVAGLGGHGWAIRVAIAEPRSLWEPTKVGHFLSPLLLSFAPVDLVLVICLPGWLKAAGDKRAGIAKGMAVAVVVAGLIGGILSTLYICSHWWYGW